MLPKVLVVATSRKTRGGITSVIKAHETGSQWEEYRCVWIQTHRDGNNFTKIVYYLTAWFEFLFYLPFCRIVHLHFSNPVSAKRKYLMMRVAKLYGKKVIAHFHAYSLEETILSTKHNLYEYLFLNADLILVLSDYWKNALINTLNVSADKVVILYNPSPKVHAEILNPLSKIILFAGTLNQRKGYKDMICAFSKIAKRHTDWKIVFAGNGEIEKGKALARELNISAQVEFLGWVSGEDKEKAFRSASIFCLPSYAEGFPVAVLDACAYGLPVITTPVGGVTDIGRDGENMLLFEPGDTDGLAIQMEKLIDDEQLRCKMQTESFKLANTTFDISSINNKLCAQYKALL